MRLFPEFLIVGAGRSGTSSLASTLRQHPDICMPDNKELQFFTLGAPHGLDLRGFFEWRPLLRASLPVVPYSIVRTREDYLAQFASARAGQLRGEASPPYLYDPHAAERIHAANPAVKIILILRNPVDRAFSHYTRRFELGTDRGRNFEEVVASEDVLAPPFREGERHFVRMGFYWQQLSRYLALFPREQVHVMLFEDYVRDFEGSLKGVLDFLGLPYSPGALQLKRENASAAPRNAALHRALAHPSKARQLLLSVQPAFVRRQLRRVSGWLRQRNMQQGVKPVLKPETRKALLAVYAEDMRQLGAYLGRDLSTVWK